MTTDYCGIENSGKGPGTFSSVKRDNCRRWSAMFRMKARPGLFVLVVQDLKYLEYECLRVRVCESDEAFEQESRLQSIANRESVQS